MNNDFDEDNGVVGDAMFEGDDFEWAASEAEHVNLGWCPHMHKALFDYFDYACGLRDGTVIRLWQIKTTTKDKRWVLLDVMPRSCCGEGTITGPGAAVLTNPDRGIWVRVSDIVWFCDAPHSS